MTASEAFGFSLLTFGLAAVRPAAVFLLLPAFSPEVVPAQVRNSIFLALGVVALVVAPPQAGALQPSIGFFLKEALIGASIGLFFAVFLYAMEVAGQIVDNVSGRSFATVVDPLGGHQTSLTGTLLGRLSQFVFMFGGGLTLLVGALIQSYAVWPMDAALPSLRAAGAGLFAGQFQSLMTTAVLFAGPVLVVLFAVDLSLGLVNRFAQQLNVFSLSMSIKAWLSVLVVMMLVPMVAEGTVAAFTEVADQVLLMLAALG
jgi:type III secretion protein T